MKKTSILMLTCFSFMLSIYAQERGLKPTDRHGVQGAKNRVALVIGNSEYKDAPLINPANDARDMAQALTALGFELIHRENLSQNEMKKAIRAFGEKIRSGGIGLFYYAGHGAQVNGKNYLIPVGANIANEEEVEYESVDVGFVLAQMESARNSMNIVILDACRNNPFARSFRSASSGLASIDAPSGTLIAYATAPGKVASDGGERNGLYTQELLRYMRLPWLSIEEVFKRVRVAVRDKTQGKQLPWESSSLVGDFYFNPAPKTTEAPMKQIPSQAVSDKTSPPTTSTKQQSDTVSEGNLDGKAISKPEASYPAAARAMRAGGVVSVEITVDEEGRVTSARAISGHPLLKQAAVDAAYKAQFPPTLSDGRPVKVTGVITYQFNP
jgi:TonB family protein